MEATSHFPLHFLGNASYTKVLDMLTLRSDPWPVLNSEERVYYSDVHRPTSKAGCICTQQNYVFRVACIVGLVLGSVDADPN